MKRKLARWRRFYYSDAYMPWFTLGVLILGFTVLILAASYSEEIEKLFYKLLKQIWK